MLNNPMLHKEMLRMRMRQSKPARIAILSAVALGIGYFYWISISNLVNEKYFNETQGLWVVVVAIQFLLIALLTPSATANAISQEREQQTWDMLLQTRLTGKEIIFGKLLARLIPSFAVILLGLPVTLTCLLVSIFHPVQNGYYNSPLSPQLFLLVHLAMLVMGLFFATFGLYMSIRFKRSLYAMLASYGFIIGVLGICTVLLTGVIQAFEPYNSRFMETFPLMWINPGYIISVLCSSNNPGYHYIPNAIIGLSLYAAATALMLTRLVTRFHKMAIA